MDIEGEEINALDGAKKTLSGNSDIKCSICSYHKDNSERYYNGCIRSILVVLNSFFNRPNVNESEKQDIEAITVYIEKKIYEALEAFETEDSNDK